MQAGFAAGDERFVGRGGELAELRSAAALADAGTVQVVHVLGEPGIGKTTLVERLGSELTAAGWAVAWGRAWTAEAGPAYEVWRQIVQTLLRSDDVAAGVPARSKPWLVELAPAASAAVGTPEVPALDGAEAREALETAVVDCVGAAALRRATCVVVDDAHAAGLPALGVLRRVVRSLHDARLLVVTTQRTVARSTDDELEHVLGDLGRAGPSLHVAPLTADEARDLVAARRGAPPAESELARLREASGGNPFFLDQLVRLADVGGGGALPTAVRRAVRERLSLLAPTTRRVVELAAVGGNAVDLHVLAQVSGLDAGTFIDAVAEAADAGLAVTAERSPGRFTFAHALVAEAAEGDLAPEDRRAGHAAFADVLAGAPGTSPIVLARHVRAAYPLVTAEAVVTATLEAAAESMRISAHEAASEACTSALGLVGAERGSTGLQARLLVALGDAEASGGQLEAAFGSLARAAACARSAGDVELMGEAVARMPRRTQFLDADVPLAGWIDEALAVVGRDWPRTRARLLARWSVEAVGADIDDRRRVSAEAVDIARDASDPAVLAECLGLRLQALWVPELAGERLEVAGDIIDLATSSGHVGRELDGRLWRAIALLELGRVDEAERELVRYQEVAERVGQPAYLLFARSRQSMLAVLRGRLDDAERLAWEAYGHAVEAGAPDAKAVLSANLTALGWLRGDDLWATAAEVAGDDRPPAVFAALMHHIAGNDAEARRLLRQGLPEIERFPAVTRFQFVAIAALVAHGVGDPDVAAAVRPTLEPLGERWLLSGGAVAAWGPLSRFTALCDLTLGDAEAAAQRLGGALEQVDATPAVTLGACLRVELADALLHRGRGGDRDRAAALLEEAMDRAVRFGLLRVEARATHLRAMVDGGRSGRSGDPGTNADGRPAEEAPPADAVGLTAREAQVLGLVAAGRSNGQIAEELYISRKTASVHVSNILRKLQVATRGEAAAAAHRLGLLERLPDATPAAGGRSLVTVVFLDVVDSTRRLAEVGDRTWVETLDRLEGVTRRRAAHHGGSIVKHTGDGVLATFPNAAGAVAFAAGMHGAATAMRLRLRAGVHAGEVERRGTDVAGLAVHLAARLTAVVAPGETLVTRTVVDLAAGSGLAFEPVGTQVLRGITEPVDVFAVRPGGF